MPTSSDVVIDVSVWVSTILVRDSNHPVALAWVTQHLLAGRLLVAPILLVTETASDVARITGHPVRGHQAAGQLYALPEMSLVQIDQTLVDEATDLTPDLRLCGADSYYVALAKKLDLLLVIFDTE